MTIIGFDLHGVLDTYPFFQELYKELYTTQDQLPVIITGSLYNRDVQSQIENLDLPITKFYSITAELLSTCPEQVKWKNGKPYAPDKIWDSQKAIICDKEKIHMLFDDSPTYGEYFKNLDTIYVQVHNNMWKESGRIS
jgi:hypothetical protein